MKLFLKLLSAAAALASFTTLGCGSEENTVILPTEIYELTDQEQANRNQAEKMLAEQRQ